MIGFNFMFTIVFLIVVGVFVMNIVRGLGEWNKNNNSPLLTVDATLVSKRSNVTHHQHNNAGDVGGTHTTTSTTYYVTFQVESGDRMELKVSGSEFGMLVEGDQDRLSFQGSRYIGFERGMRR